MQAELGGDIGVAERAGCLGMRVGIDHELHALRERRRRGANGQAEQYTEKRETRHRRVGSGTKRMR